MPTNPKRYAALLRGVSPMNLRMADLKRCLEGAGYEHVVTVRSSGNVVFDVPRATSRVALERRLECLFVERLTRGFSVLVRSVVELEALLATDPYTEHGLPSHAKRVVTFLRTPLRAKLTLPIADDDAWILAQQGAHLCSAYVAGDKGPVFMSLIEKTCGKDVTTRTWESVRSIARA